MENEIIDSGNDAELVEQSKKNFKDYLVEFVKAIVCGYYKKTVDDFDRNHNLRNRDYSLMRQIIFYLLRQNSEITYMEIGRKFSRDHATVIYSVRQLKNLMSWDKTLKRQVEELQELVTLRAKASVSNLDLEDDFYWVDLDKIISLKINKKKAIVLVGFSEEEIARMKSNLPVGTERRDLDKTGMYILENKFKKQ